MAPKPLIGVLGPQNGCHMHISLNNASPQLSDLFLAGILNRMKAICAFGMANYDSYARVVDDGCGLWIGWGTENRDLPIRKVDKDHWEIRFLDATVNGYLAVAATLGAGLEGIRADSSLTFKDCSVFPRSLTPQQRAEYGITERMPLSLRETLDAANVDDGILECFGPALLAKYSEVKEKEISLRPDGGGAEGEKYLTFF